MYVVAGEVLLVAQNTQLELGSGDVARFGADGDHVYRTADTAARLLTVVTIGDD